MTRVNPEILVWARSTAGLSVEEAARKLNITPARLEAFESGEREPTRKQILNMSEKFRRPLIIFYLDAPPRIRNRGQDFRNLPDDAPQESEPLLNTLVRSVQARQQLLRSALEEADEDTPLAFVGSADLRTRPEVLADNIRNIINVSLQDFRRQRTVTEAFAALRDGAERVGIFVLLMGNLGTHHTNIPVQSFRGFALADEVTPFVVINENDSRAAWAFTLVHELAHIWLGQTGISGYGSNEAIERYCDLVAARFLLPENEIEELRTANRLTAAQWVERITGFADMRNLSRKMVAYNLFRSEIINQNIYAEVSNLLDADRIAQREEQRNREGEGGPNYYVVRRHRMGAALVSTVDRLVSLGALTIPKAGTVLGVKATSVGSLVAVER